MRLVICLCQLPCILVIGLAALAAELIRRLIFEHLNQNLAAQTDPKQLIWVC